MLLSLCFAMLIGPPWVPQLFAMNDPAPPARSASRFSLLDASWMMATHEQFINHVDVSQYPFMTGPWGFLYHGYHPGTYPWQLIAWGGLTLILWWGLAVAIAGGVRAGWLCAFFITLLFCLAWRGIDLDALFFTFFAVFIAIRSGSASRRYCAIEWVFPLALSLIALVKFSYFVCGAGVMLIATGEDIFRRRRIPWGLLVYAAGLAALWLAAWQPLENFPLFVRNGWDVSSHFDDAMSLPAKLDDAMWFPAAYFLRGPWPYLIAAAATCGVVIGALQRTSRWAATWAALASAWLLFVCFKAGHVRDEPLHRLDAALPLLIFVVLMSLTLRKMGGRSGWKTGAGAATLLALGVVSLGLHAGGSRWLGWQIIGCARSARQSVRCITEWLDGPSVVEQKYSDDMERLRAAYAVPALAGSVDVYPNDALIASAHELDWRPRPVIQSYAVFSLRLAELNAVHLRSAKAADNILFTISPLDDRFPSLDDGRSWPELLTRYDIAGIYDITKTHRQGLLLKKAATPRDYMLTALTQTVTGFGKRTNIPDAGGKPLWIEIDVRRSLQGKLLAAAYKTPIIRLYVETPGGMHDYRLPIAMARAGFVLSPIIPDARSFALLAAAGGIDHLKDQAVSRLTINIADEDPRAGRWFEPNIELRFFTLDLPPQPGLSAQLPELPTAP